MLHNCCWCVCSIHVASVVQMTHMLLVHGGVLKSKVMNRTQQLATYWSATVHDYEHGGLNNDFLIKTAHPLAITYNDSSPLENHHLAASSRVLYMPEYCFPPVSLLSSCTAVSEAYRRLCLWLHCASCGHTRVLLPSCKSTLPLLCCVNTLHVFCLRLHCASCGLTRRLLSVCNLALLLLCCVKACRHSVCGCTWTAWCSTCLSLN